MRIKNTEEGYGLVAILLHWIMAFLIIGLLVLGVYMVELGYYDKWYNAAPWWHKATGMLVFLLLLIRFLWLFINVHPKPLPNFHKFEIWLAKITHWMFYLLLILICLSGYFITTAKGSGVDIFGWFIFPAITELNAKQAAIIGDMHALTSYFLAFFFALHLVASCKHHFTDRDATLIRIIKPVFKGAKK